MSPPAPQSVRRRFLVAVGHGLYLTWPVLSGILVLEVALGLLIGFVEGWSLGEAVYFSFITQNRAVYSFPAQTSPIPAAIERRYVGVGNRSQPLGRDRSAHLLGHRRAILAGGVAERGVEWGGSSQASVSAASAGSARSRFAVSCSRTARGHFPARNTARASSRRASRCRRAAASTA